MGKYEQTARELARAIAEGVYGVGERFPSLRQTSKQFTVSLATAVMAYRKLEDEGWIEARPRSGYFVRLRAQPGEPAQTRPKPYPTPVTVGQLAMSLVDEVRSPRLLKLGAAVPAPDLLPLGALSRTMAGVARRHWREPAAYEEARGNAALRKQIARLMREAGCACAPDDVLVTNGCLEALSLALRATATPGDAIAIESPTYFGILQLIETLGMQALEIPTHPRDGIDPEALQQAIRKRKISAAILMPNFNSPLGSCMPDASKQRVVQLLSDANIPLIEDDVYGFLSYEQRRPKSTKAYDVQQNVLYCSSFSKTVAPGLRIGWIVPGRYYDRVKYLKFLDNISTANHTQSTMAEFLAKGAFTRSVRSASRIYQQRMEQLRYWVNDCFPDDTRLSHPTGGFLLWVELPKTIDCMELYRKALEKRIAISPGILFSAQGQYRHHVRLSCGVVEGEQARESVKTLGRLAKALL